MIVNFLVVFFSVPSVPSVTSVVEKDGTTRPTDAIRCAQ
jgi:hypothetical protein